MTGSPPTRARRSRTSVVLMLRLGNAPLGCSRAQPVHAQRCNSHLGSRVQVNPLYAQGVR